MYYYCSTMFYPPFVPAPTTYPILLQACEADGITEDTYLYADGSTRTVAEVAAHLYDLEDENPHTNPDLYY